MSTEMIPDPLDSSVWFVGSAAESSMGVQVGDATLGNVHDVSKCAGEACLVHNPSDHHMRGWRLNWRDDRGLMERICPAHGVGHPDPDGLAFHERQGRDWMGVHGCCGCCWGAS